MTPHAKVSRLIEIEQFLLCGFDNLPVERQSPILHEALGLSEELELDRSWRYYKGRLEALQQTELQRKKAEIAEKGGIVMYEWDVYYEEANGNDPRKWIGTIQANTGADALHKASFYFEHPEHDLVVKRKEDNSPQTR